MVIKISKYIIVLLLTLSLSGCFTSNNTGPVYLPLTSSVSVSETLEPSADDYLDESSQIIIVQDAVITSTAAVTSASEVLATDEYSDYDKTAVPLIASLPEDDIYLYGIKPKGVVLYYKGIGKFFDWSYTARHIFPRMKTSDFDNDGINELAVILHIGSGTGVSVDELHILEISEIYNEYAPNENELYDLIYDDNFIDCNKLLLRYLHTEIVGTETEQTAEITLDDVKYTVPLEQYIINDIQYTGAAFGDIIGYEFTGDSITALIAVGLTCDERPALTFFGGITATVIYSPEGSELSDLTFDAIENN
jgi:hypothetical protein